MSDRIQLFGVAIDRLNMAGAVARVMSWLDAPGEGCRYVVTPNVDHTVLLTESAALRDVYADAPLVLADGWPVVLAARLLRKRLPERVAGSDLVPALCEAAQATGRPLKLFLLGAMPGVGDRARANIERRWPLVQVTGVYSPPLGFEKGDAENANILRQIADAQPDVLVVGLGAPKQELWVHRHRDAIAAPAALCVGATIDFLAGEKKRAPMWMRRLGLEWLHRAASEPKRLARRYARDAWIFPQLVWREWRSA
jgi:N-acetylglucosaminyldiphosphoundecaprenol N-acetyl-beta-D-mannosaminyltransferase